MAACSTLNDAAAPASSRIPKELFQEILLLTLTVDDPSPSEAVRRAGSLRLLSKDTSEDFLHTCKYYVRATAAPTIKTKCDHYKEPRPLNADELEFRAQEHVARMRGLHGVYDEWDPQYQFNPFGETRSSPFVCEDEACQRLVADSKRIGALSINNQGSATAVANLADLHQFFLSGKRHDYIYIKPAVAALLAGEYRKDNQGARPSYLHAVQGVDNFIRKATCGVPEAKRYWRYCARTNRLDMLDSEVASPCTHPAEDEGYCHRILDLEGYHDTPRDYLRAFGQAPKFRHHVSVCCSSAVFDATPEPVVDEDGTVLPSCRVSNELGDRCECPSCPVTWRNDWPNDEAYGCDDGDEVEDAGDVDGVGVGVWPVDEMIRRGLI